MNPIVHLAAATALGCVSGAAFADLQRFEIPDYWSIAITALFAVAAVSGIPVGQWWPHLAAGAAVFGMGVLLFSRGWLGGGDVKLLAACALWSGLGGLPLLLGGTAIAGGALALAAIVARRFAGSDPAWPALQRNGPLPYAVAILGGAAALAAAMP